MPTKTNDATQEQTIPHAGTGPVDPLSRSDLDRIESLDLDNFHVLNALARLCGISMETVNPERVRWYATPKVGATFSGSYPEVRAFVKGYALCYRWALATQSLERIDLLRAIEKMHDDAALDR